MAIEQILTKRIVLLGLAVIVFLAAWNRGIPLLYLMFSLLLATLLLGHLLPLRALSSVHVQRKSPKIAVEGDIVTLEYTLQNTGWMPRFMLEVVDSFPAAEYENIQPSVFISQLPAHSSMQQQLNIRCAVRGEFILGPIHLLSAFPLGIACRKKNMSNDANLSTLLVYPTTFPIAYVPILPKNSMHLDGGESISTAGGSEEFFGIREYRQGDSIRMVHWPSSARRGQLLVKEMEMRVSAQVSILLDMHIDAHAGRSNEHSLEYGIKIAASLCRYALDRMHQVQFIAFGERQYISSCQHGINHLQVLLTMLAKVKSGNIPFFHVIKQANDFMQDGQTIVLICSGRSLDAIKMRHVLAILQAKRMQIIVVLIKISAFGGDDLPNVSKALSHAGLCYYHISKGQEFSSLFPPQL